MKYSINIRLVSLLLSLALIIVGLPLTVFAEGISELVENASSVDKNAESSDQEVADILTDSFEVTELREETVKHFRTEDGSYVAAQYDMPVHYLDDNGKWQDIDNTLSESGSEYSTRDAKVKFAKKITGNESLFTLHDGNGKITMSLDGAIKKTQGVVVANESANDSMTKLQKMMALDKLSGTIVYADILPGVDLEYVVQPYQVKENIIVKETQDEYVYSFTIKLNNLDAVLNEDGSVSIVDPDTDEIVYGIPAPVVYDSNFLYAPEGVASYTLTQSGNKYTLAVSVDSAWMNAEERAFPVIVDPTIYKGGRNLKQMRDTFVSSKNPSSKYGSNTHLRVGYDSTYGYTRAYVLLKDLPALPNNAIITNAKLNLQLTSLGVTTRVYLGAYTIDFSSTSMWSESTVTWNTHSAQFTDVLDYLIINGGQKELHYSWDVTETAKKWYDGTLTNHGIAIGLIEETLTSTNYVDFCSSENTSNDNGTYLPFYSISYRDTKGVEDYYSYYSASAGVAGTGSINYATGALTFSKSLLATTDSLLPYTPAIVYNSGLSGLEYQYPNAQVSYWGDYMPRGFKLSIQETLIRKSYLSSDHTDKYFYVWADGDGTEHYFHPVEGSDTEYRDEDGLQLVLDASSTSVITITDSSKSVRRFNKLSSTPDDSITDGWYLKSITDVNGNMVSFTFDGGTRPTTISLTPNGSTKIDFLTIAYNSSYMPYVIWNDAADEAIVFRYSTTPTGSISSSDTKYLREVVYVRGNASVGIDQWKSFYESSTNSTNITTLATATYSYDSSGKLLVAKDCLSDYELRFTYTGTKVTTVQEYANSTTAGQKANITYTSGYTEVRTSGTDDVYGTADDLVNRFVFDNAGRVITSYTTDVDRTKIYGVSSGAYETDNVLVANSLKVSSTAGGISANYLMNGSFEKSAGSLLHWYVSGTTRISKNSNRGYGVQEAELEVGANTTSSIYQYVYLRSGKYTLSMDVNTVDSDDLTIKIIATSQSDSTRVFEKEVSYNRDYASGGTAFDYFTFTANDITNGGEVFQIRISVTGGADTASGTTVQVDNVMLAKTDGAQAYNMVFNSDFETTCVYSNGNTNYGPSSFWEMSSNSSSSNTTFHTAYTPFFQTLKLTGVVGGKQSAEQAIYTASTAQLNEYASDDGATQGPQVFNVSGFAKAVTAMHNYNGVFALRVDVVYYLSDDETDTESYYFDFCEYSDEWQYVSGTFVIPADSMVKEIRVACEYSYNVGVAYFDNISVTYNPDGDTTQYIYDEQGRTTHIIDGYDVIVYSYEDDGDLHEKITRTGWTIYSYDDCHRVAKEEHYAYDGNLYYLATYDNMIDGLGNSTLEMSAEYEYDSFGLLKKSIVKSPNESKQFITQTSYNTDAGSRIFGSIDTTTDSLGKVTRYFYSENNGRLLANIQPDGNGTCYSYDSLGNIYLVLPATYSSNTWNRDTGSASVMYTYNALNQLESVRTTATQYNFTYNVFGAKDSVAIGDTTIVSQTYNNYNGKIKSVTYANGCTINYTYDELDRVKEVVYNSGVKYNYEYDSNGRLSKFVDNSLGRTTLYKYDESGRMTNYIEYDSDSLENLAGAWYVYDDSSRITGIYYSQDYLYDSSDYYSARTSLSYQYLENGNLSQYKAGLDNYTYWITPTYDDLDRITAKQYKISHLNYDSTPITSTQDLICNVTYGYKSSGTNGSVVVSQYTSKINSGSTKTFKYSYDSGNVNITQITDASGNILNKYTYDRLGRLTREDNAAANRSYLYTYDRDGNILSKKVYGFTTTTGTPTTTLYYTYNYTYGNSDWGDQLTTYRGYNITYDSVGNPLTFFNDSWMTLSWANGSELASATKNSVTTYYTYNDSGIRTGKTVGGVEHTYLLDGSLILSEAYDSKLFIYVYDENGAPIGIRYRVNAYGANAFDYYFFEKNYQGDIIGIYTASGTRVVWYEYDAWGNLVSSGNTPNYLWLKNANPFRYRGYYYDIETGFYYCGSRYYDPTIGRFISPDSTNTLMNTPMAYTDKNLYAYCDNNPVMRVDHGGAFWDTVFDVISLCVSVVDVVKNPDDPWAWVGLGADVASLVVPFATGGGLIVDIATKGDDVVDFAKKADKVKDVGKKIKNGITEVFEKITDCFVSGTLISTAHGSVPIENIKIGDYVWATDPDTGDTALKKVVNTFVNETTEVTHITYNGETITSTQSHPYYVVNQGWVFAKSLRAGDILATVNGEYVIVEFVQHELLESPITTYNFEVEDYHTYYVGDNEVLVHNKCFRGELMEATNRSKSAAKGYDAHHVFPQKFGDKFEKAGFTDWNDAKQYGAWWPLNDHRSKAYEYNKKWGEFFNDEIAHTKDDILKKGRELAKEYGFEIRF